ncbi:MAG: hypothetical protein KC620_25845, partial [Myxococcales bacterium]|nr:hypothetical protein [Myxococcales bacterium]
GAGNFYSLHDQNSLDGIFAAEFDAARATIARGVAVQFRTAPGVQVIDAAGYPIEHADGISTFRPGDLAAGQTRRVFVTLRVPTHMPAERALGDVALNFISDGVQRSTPIAALPAVACVADEATFTAGLDKATWERSVVEGAYANIEKQVAAQVRAGDAAGARALLAGYRARTETLNSAVGSVAVADHLGRLGAIEAQIDDAFTGADQSKKQNVFSKSLNRSGWLHSRAGVSY